MKFVKYLFAMVALAFAAIACDTPADVNEIPLDGQGYAFKIKATLGGDYSRATDTSFEKGDAISVFAYKGGIVLPENATPEDIVGALANFSAWIDNAKFTKGDKGFISEKEYKWYKGEEVSQIFGIYPFNDKLTALEVLTNGVGFCVQSDQSTHAGYTASDLMYAAKDNVVPTDEEVLLTFNHLLSKVVIDVKNERSEKVVCAYLDGVQGNITFQFPHLSTVGDKGTIRAGELATPTEGYTNSFALIIPNQKVAPKLAFVTEKGEQITFDAPEEIEFGTGKVRHLTVTITPESISAEFDAIVNDWSADPEVEFKDQPGSGDQPGEGEGEGDQPGEGEGEGDEIAQLFLVSSEGNQFTLFKGEGEIYSTGLSLLSVDQGFSIVAQLKSGELISYGGDLISTVLPIELSTENKNGFYFPCMGEYIIDVDYEKLSVEITPVKVFNDYTYVGEGSVNEGYLTGITWSADVLYNSAENRAVFLTPFGELYDHLSKNPYENIKVAEDGTLPFSYITLQSYDATYKGQKYSAVRYSLPNIITGLMYKHMDYDWAPLRLNYSVAETIVPFHRMVGDGIYQIAPLYQLVGLGSFLASERSNQTLTFLFPNRTIRDAKYNLIGINYVGVPEGSSFPSFELHIERHLHTMALISVAEHVTDENVLSVINANLNNVRVFDYVQSGTKDDLIMIEWDPGQTGRYALIALGLDANNQVISTSYTNYSYTKAGEDGPPCVVELDAKKDPLRPEDQISVKMKGENITSAYYTCMPNKAEYATMSDDELIAACDAYGYHYLTGYLSYVNEAGYSEVFTKLQPSTEYIIVGWFTNDFGSRKVLRRTVTTDAAAQWTSLGIGRYQDLSHFFNQTEATRSAVEIMQDSDGSPHYRVMKPYAGYWSRYSEGYIGHCGDYLELAVYDLKGADGAVVRHVCFDPHSTGLEYNGYEIIMEHPYNAYSSTNVMKYPMRDMCHTVYMTSPNQMNDGTKITLAPWYMMGDTNSGFNYSGSNAIVIMLPWEGSENIGAEEIGPITRAAILAPQSVASTMKPVNDGGVVVKGGTRSDWGRGRMVNMRPKSADDSFSLQ